MQRELEEFAAENSINVTAEAEVTPRTARVSLACHQLIFQMVMRVYMILYSFHPSFFLSHTLTAPVINQKQ